MLPCVSLSPPPSDAPALTLCPRQVNTDQMLATIDVLKTYGTDHVSGVTVGNEFVPLLLLSPSHSNSFRRYILNQLNQATAVQFIVTQMTTFRDLLAAQSPPISLPVGTADAGSMITSPLSAGADFVYVPPHVRSRNDLTPNAGWRMFIRSLEDCRSSKPRVGRGITLPTPSDLIWRQRMLLLPTSPRLVGVSLSSC